MDIKLRNRLLNVLAIIISIYFLSVSIISAIDINRFKQYVIENHYFNSQSYYNDLREYFENIKLLLENTQNTSNVKVNNLKNIIDSNTFVKYYIKNRNNGEIYSNFEDTSNIDINTNPQILYVDTYLKDSNIDYDLRNINNWFKTKNYEGKFIFLKTSDGYSQMEKNYNYFQSKRSRVIKEIFLCIVTFTIGSSILIGLRFFIKKELSHLDKIRNSYEQISIDLRTLIFMLYFIIMMIYFHRAIFFYTPISLRHFFQLTIVAIYVLYLILNLLHVITLIANKSLLVSQLKKSLFYQVIYLIRESFKTKVMVFKTAVIFTLTTLLGIFIFLGLYDLTRNSSSDALFAISAVYIFLYMLFVPVYILKRIVSINKIIEATDEISLGNLDYFIEENGSSTLDRLTHNINNMKTGFRNSVESQLKSEKLKTELITNVSHDLKTPLTSIINYVNLLKKDGISEEENKSYLDVLDQKSQRLKILIEDLFEASKVSSGSVELNLEMVDIAALLRQALGESDEKISSSSLTFRVNIPNEEVYLNLDGKRTWRVFENLINNALKYSQNNSRVYIDLEEHADKVMITIKNVSSYEMDFDVNEIFERFKRGDKARSTEGSGLGLSIAKSIVELQGGKMHINIDGDLFKVSVEFKKNDLHEIIHKPIF